MSDAIKCLVWDLDNTMWSGTLVESGACRLRPGMRDVLRRLDRRGILLSIASLNDPDQALPVLRRKRIDGYFLHPQIGWGNKVNSLRAIASRLGVALDAVGFVDDEPYERERVLRMLPAVRVYPAAAYRELTRRPEFHPGALSAESRARRLKYQQAESREEARESMGISHGEFLRYANMRLALRRAARGDVPRILELLRRTHQLNSTGVIYGPDAVRAWLRDPRYAVFVAELEDRFVDYGRIGVAVCRRRAKEWELVSFLLSCRVLSRGISGYVLAWVEQQAARHGAEQFLARYRANERNRRMQALYGLAGLKPTGVLPDGTQLFGGAPRRTIQPPRWLSIADGTIS
ncbi:MAG TPA: HAD-IIIC family phosphatase [Candidatus Eisenbacteria bacterium]|nr:HAD-IIIC family phosphatase [Candidatus Eisenbacteria bacterium]